MKLRYKIDLIFVMTAIIVGILLMITFQNVSYVKESSDIVSRANFFLHQLEYLKSSIINVETSSRGYIISGNDGHIEDFEEAKYETLKALESIRPLIAEKYQLQQHIGSLERLINEKIEVSELNITLRKTEDLESAAQHVASGRGKALMEELVELIKTIDQQEHQLLIEAIDDNKALAVKQHNIYVALFIIIFSLILIFHIHIRKNTFKVFAYEEKQAELIKKLNYQNKQLDDFVNIISHNLRSPVSNITSLIALLNDKANANSQELILEKLNTVSVNLNESFDELLEAIHIKQNTEIPREELAISEVCNKVVNSLQGDIMTKDASINCDFTECDTIYYPKAYLESILHNLLSNALKYSSPARKPEISVIAALEEGIPVLRVSDNGLGMDLKRIGDKLFGLRKIFHTTVNAKGIGLFMTKAHIESLGGRIEVESEVDKGTSFIVYFDERAFEKPSKLIPKKAKMPSENLSTLLQQP